MKFMMLILYLLGLVDFIIIKTIKKKSKFLSED